MDGDDLAHPELPASQHRWQSLGEAFDPRANSLGFLRFVLALFVLITHSFPLGGFHGGRDPMWGWTRDQESLGGFAVGGFFVISGFLITRSLASTPSLRNFLWRRCLRILPGFWVCLLVTAFVFGPVAWVMEHDGIDGYLGAAPTAFEYVRSNFWVSIHQYQIAGLLSDTPYGRSGALAFDGSLWTLIYEIKCYLGLAALGALGLVHGCRQFVVALLASVWLVQLANRVSPGSSGRALSVFQDPQVAILSMAFLLGAVLYLYRDSIPMTAAGAAAAASVLVASIWLHWYPVFGPLALGYLWFWLAVRLPLRHFSDRADVSYGLYIYAFPVQQMVALAGWNRFGFVPYVLICVAITLVLATASWFLVEKPCLRLKNLRLSHMVTRGPPTPHAVDADLQLATS